MSRADLAESSEDRSQGGCIPPRRIIIDIMTMQKTIIPIMKIGQNGIQNGIQRHPDHIMLIGPSTNLSLLSGENSALI